jgi:hypothetical protein
LQIHKRDREQHRYPQFARSIQKPDVCNIRALASPSAKGGTVDRPPQPPSYVIAARKQPVQQSGIREITPHASVIRHTGPQQARHQQRVAPFLVRVEGGSILRWLFGR